MRINSEVKLDFKDVLIRPKRSTLKSRQEVRLNRKFTFCHAKDGIDAIPLIAANMDHIGTFEVAKALSKHKTFTAIHKFTTKEDWQAFAKEAPEALPYAFVSTGITERDFDNFQSIMKVVDVPNICIDVANGYTQTFVDYLKRVRDLFPEKVIMAGNVVTGEMVEELILQGADIVKVGIGPGSVCTTRKKTGVGYPQLSAIIECADAAHGLGGWVCADGGCTSPGDVAKAFGAGGDFVMLGGMLAGHDENSGSVIEENGKKFKRFYGMSSEEAMMKHSGNMASYRASEGKSVDVPYRGSIEGTILDILGGLRSTCTYVGASLLKELSKRTTFIRVTQQLNEIFSPFNVDGR